MRHLLSSWARWTADGKPIPFSILGDSPSSRPFEPRHRRTYVTDSALWADPVNDYEEHVADLIAIDKALYGALSERERRILFAGVVPLGRACPAAERAAAAGVDVDTLRAIQRRAVQLIG